MIKINFNKHIHGDDRKVIRQAANYFLSNLLSKRKLDNTFVDLSFVNMPKFMHGFCNIHDDDDNAYNPTQFRVEINGSLKRNDIIRAIAHEFVHLRQFRNKELQYRNGFNRFRGKTYSLDIDYKNEPWEKEAFKLEEQLYNQFIKESV
jgi:hypothetical protein